MCAHPHSSGMEFNIINNKPNIRITSSKFVNKSTKSKKNRYEKMDMHVLCVYKLLLSLTQDVCGKLIIFSKLGLFA